MQPYTETEKQKWSIHSLVHPFQSCTVQLRRIIYISEQHRKCCSMLAAIASLCLVLKAWWLAYWHSFITFPLSIFCWFSLWSLQKSENHCRFLLHWAHQGKRRGSKDNCLDMMSWGKILTIWVVVGSSITFSFIILSSQTRCLCGEWRYCHIWHPGLEDASSCCLHGVFLTAMWAKRKRESDSYRKTFRAAEVLHWSMASVGLQDLQ